MSETTVARGFLRNYYSGRPDDPCACCGSVYGHASYSGVLHDEATDEHINCNEAINAHLRALPEGTVVAIVVRRVGWTERAPFVLLKPHVYGVRDGAEKGAT
jgi:hypothetical protein